MSYLVALAFVAILASLGAALYFMTKQSDRASDPSKRMARALAYRVGFSILLFACILLAWKLDYLHPTGIAAGQ
jgi:cytochrome bd-type quinol oxidase subunit 2